MEILENKRGFLLAEETLKIIIALISISFLIYFLVSLYMSSQDDKDLGLAKASLEHLIQEVNSEATSVEIYNPSSSILGTWWILSWPYEGVEPKSCENLDWDKCLCICKKSKTSFKSEHYSNDCDEQGICMESDILIDNNLIKIEKPLPLKLNIQYNEKEIIITK